MNQEEKQVQEVHEEEVTDEEDSRKPEDRLVRGLGDDHNSKRSRSLGLCP